MLHCEQVKLMNVTEHSSHANHFPSTHYRLLYNSSDDTYTNNTGAEVRVPGFGDTNTVEYLDTPPAIPYFNSFVDYFVARGYERGNTIRAAPYDWRLAAGNGNRQH